MCIEKFVEYRKFIISTIIVISRFSRLISFPFYSFVVLSQKFEFIEVFIYLNVIFKKEDVWFAHK